MKTLKFILLIAISSLSAWSCKQTVLEEQTSQEQPIAALQALVIEQPNLAANPPIAQDFIIQQLARTDLNGNNFLFKAVFNPEEPRLINVKSFTVQVSEGTQVLLNDTGRDGDERAGDRIFSAFVKDDIPRITTFVNDRNGITQRNNQVVTQFAGRSMVNTRATLIDAEAFIAKRPVTLGGSVATAAVTAPVFAQLKGNSLMITDLGVVQDPTRTYNPCIGGTAGGNPNGAWTFKKLMTNMANTAVTGVSADNFVKNWINTELFGQKTIATSLDITTPPVRDDLTNMGSPKRKVIAAWLKNSGIIVNQTNINNWQTLLINKLEFFPVRLLAIVNRLDLRGNFGYTGGSDNGGEGRFVFCFMDSNNGCTSAGKLTIILEYGIPINNCGALKNYAQQWYNLKNMTLGSATYNTALENITNVFTNVNAGGTNKANNSALNHLRSNEFLMSPWNIRDCEINKVSHQLNLIHPNKEPMSEANINSSPTLAAKISSLVAFANLNATSIETEGAYTISNDIKGVDAQMPSPSYFWNNAGITSDLARHKLSLNTCSGCHTGETKTSFTHVGPTNFGTPATLSSFLTGLGSDDDFSSTDNDANPMSSFSIKDPANRPASAPTVRGFNDLLRRANDLETLIATFCGGQGTIFGLAELLRFQPISAD